MFAKVVIAALLLAIIVSLASGMFFLVNDDSRSRRTLNALTLRIGLSITLILFLLIAYRMGWITPHAGPG